MSSHGKLEVEVEVKSPADKYWETMRDSTTVFPKAFPEDYKSIQIIEGDGKSVGSVRHITYGEGSAFVKESIEKIEGLDEENKLVTYGVIAGDLPKYYKQFRGIIQVIPKGDGSIVKWGCEFEKVSGDIPDPHLIQDFAIKNFKELDEYLLKA